MNSLGIGIGVDKMRHAEGRGIGIGVDRVIGVCIGRIIIN
jgi:hypothetical protein